jgi:hypothetical protein
MAPQYDDLATIIAHALAWDEQLQEARAGAAMRPDDPWALHFAAPLREIASSQQARTDTATNDSP